MFGETGFQGVHYGGGVGFGGEDDAMDAEFAQGAGGDGADCGHSDTVLQNAELLAPREFHETVNGAGTEEKYGIRFSARDTGEFFLIGIARTDCAIGSDFGGVSAELSQRGRQIGIGAIAAREQHALATQATS